MKPCDKLFDEECLSYYDNRSKISIKEKGKTFLGNNKKGKYFALYHVDGCIINDNTKRCDYLLLDCDDSISYFIELKGADLTKAINQIDATLDRLLPNVPSSKVNARIVLSKTRTPDIKTTEMKALEKRLRALGGNLKYDNILLKEDI